MSDSDDYSSLEETDCSCGKRSDFQCQKCWKSFCHECSDEIIDTEECINGLYCKFDTEICEIYCETCCSQKVLDRIDKKKSDKIQFMNSKD